METITAEQNPVQSAQVSNIWFNETRMKHRFPSPQDTSWFQYPVHLGESCTRIGNVHNNGVVMNSVEVIVRKRKIKGIGNLEQSVGQSGFLGYRSCNVNL